MPASSAIMGRTSSSGSCHRSKRGRFPFRPLRLRIEDEEHRLLRVDIEEVVTSKEIQYVGIEAQIFLCKATVEGKPWMFELKYTIRSHSWHMFRRIY